MEGRTNIWKFSLCSTGHWSFGAAAQKGIRLTPIIPSYTLTNQPLPFTPSDSLAIWPVISKNKEIKNHPFVSHPFLRPIMQLKWYERLRGDTVNLICILQLYSDKKKLTECLLYSGALIGLSYIIGPRV